MNLIKTTEQEILEKDYKGHFIIVWMYMGESWADTVTVVDGELYIYNTLSDEFDIKTPSGDKYGVEYYRVQ